MTTYAVNRHTGKSGLFRTVVGAKDGLTGRIEPDRIVIYLPASGAFHSATIYEFKKHWEIRHPA